MSIHHFSSPWFRHRYLIVAFLLGIGVFGSCISPLPAQVTPNIAPGTLLIAHPRLQDPNFRQTVVLICQHDATKTIGLILNRPSDILVSKVLPKIPASEEAPPVVYAGGPVRLRGILMLLEADREFSNTRQVMEGLYFGGNLKVIQQMMATPNGQKRFRIYAGHASWFPGQLRSEVERGFWMTYPANSSIVFDENPSSLWKYLMDNMKAPRRLISHTSPGSTQSLTSEN